MAHQTPGGVGVRRAPAFALIALLSLAFLAFSAPAGSAARGPARERSTFRSDTLDVPWQPTVHGRAGGVGARPRGRWRAGLRTGPRCLTVADGASAG